ncbi:hypothetical protein Hanom_Chr07g00598261 [Helianthus anomalus]
MSAVTAVQRCPMSMRMIICYKAPYTILSPARKSFSLVSPVGFTFTYRYLKFILNLIS